MAAARLSETEGTSVLLLEAGGQGPDPSVGLVPGLAASLWTGAHARVFSTVPQTAVARRVVPLTVGTGVGGGSAINAMGWLHGQPADYQQWEEMGALGWGWRDMLPVLRSLEDHELGAGKYHGAGGPIAVSSPRDLHPLALALLQAADRGHWPLSADINGVDRVGLALGWSHIRDGQRSSPAQSYLQPALERDNLEMQTDCPVSHILFEGGRAVGVRCSDGDGGERQIEARHGVVLTAGAIGSAHLLLRSGVGPVEQLRRFDIEVVRDLPAVGQGLQDHPAVPVPYRLREAGRSPDPGRPNAQEAYALLRRGPLSAFAHLIAPLRATSPPAADAPPETIFALVPMDWAQESGSDAPDGLCLCGLIDTNSRGSVTLASADAEEVVVDPAYLQATDDRPRLRAALRTLYRLFNAEPVSRLAYFLVQLNENDESLDQLIDTSLTSYFHPVGTLRMGTGPAAVVDPRLAVHDLEHLWVADASVMPRITRGHTLAPTLAIAERAAKWVAASRCSQ